MATKGGASVAIRVVSNRIPQVSAQVHQLVVAQVETAGRQIEAYSKARTPVLTGTLRRSIHTVLSNGGMTATVGPSVEYGIFVEMGTRNMAARPYMRPAAALVYPRFIDGVKAALRGLK